MKCKKCGGINLLEYAKQAKIKPCNCELPVDNIVSGEKGLGDCLTVSKKPVNSFDYKKMGEPPVFKMDDDTLNQTSLNDRTAELIAEIKKLPITDCHNNNTIFNTSKWVKLKDLLDIINKYSRADL